MTTTVRDRSVTFDGVTYLTAPVVAPLVGGTFHVHAAGCGDLRKSAYREARESGELDAPWETRSLSDLVRGSTATAARSTRSRGSTPMTTRPGGCSPANSRCTLASRSPTPRRRFDHDHHQSHDRHHQLQQGFVHPNG